MTQFGSVLIFKASTTKEEAAEALAQIGHLLDVPSEWSDPVYFTDEHNQKRVRYERRDFRYDDLVHEFEPEYGEPVWYIP